MFRTWPGSVGHFDGGMEQIERFLKEHECNLICRSLGLDVRGKALHCAWFVLAPILFRYASADSFYLRIQLQIAG
jgi:hypothetical protein